MSIKVVGSRPLSTGSIPNILGGGTAASLSARLQFASGVWPVDQAILFSAKYFDFGLYCNGATPGTIFGQIITTTGSESHQAVLSVDKGHHVALIYDGTSLVMWIDSVVVATKPLTGNLSSLAGQFFLGMVDAAGPKESWLDDVAFWSGYALTPQDVADLNDRAKAPTAIAPASLAFALSLDGPDGVAVADGSPGIIDLSANARPVSTSSSKPVYSSLVLDSSPSVRVRTAKLGINLDTLFVELESSDGLDVKIASFDSHPRLTVGNGMPLQLGNPSWNSKFGRIMYLLPGPIAVGAVATLDANVRWATTSLGLAAAVVGRAVDTSATGVLPAYDPALPRTMRVGYNVSHDLVFGLSIVSANLRERFAGYQVHAGVVLDADGFLTAASSPGPFYTSVTQTFNGPVPGRSPYVVGAPGLWTLTYTTDNEDHLALSVLSDGGATCVLQPGRSDETGPVKRRVYLVELGTDTTAHIRLTTLSYHSRLLGIYPPGVDAANPPQFYPPTVRALAGSKVLRSLDFTLINNSNIVEYAHWHQPTAICAETPALKIDVPIVSVGPDPNAGGYRDASTGRILFTTAAAHGLFEGQVCNYRGATSGPTGNGIFPITGGATVDLKQISSLVHVLSPTTFTLEVGSSSGGGGTLTQTYAGTALQATGSAPTVHMEAGLGGSPQKMVDLCNEVGADLWFCMPLLMSDAGVTATMTMIAERLTPGLKVHLELSNETWNYSFHQTGYCRLAGRQEGLSSYHFYARRSGQVHALGRAAFVAAGRAATDVIRTVGTQGSNAAATEEIATYCQANAIPIDELAVATYIGINEYFEADFDQTAEATYRSMSVGQSHDLYEVQMARGSWKKLYRDNHRAVLDAQGFAATKISGYEGAVDHGCPMIFSNDQPEALRTTLTLAQRGEISRAVLRHPRMTATVGAYLRMLDENWGFDTFCWFKFDGLPYTDPVFGSNSVCWSTIWSHEALFDSAATPASVRNVDPDDLTKIVSTNGTAIYNYVSPDGLGTGGPPPPPPPPPVPATAYALSVPQVGTAGVPVTVTATAGAGSIAGTIVVTPTATTGVVFTGTASLTDVLRSRTFTATKSAGGVLQVATTNSGSLADPTPALVAIAVRPAAADVREGVDRGDGVLGTLDPNVGGFDPLPAGERLRFPGRQTTIRPLKGESRGPFGDRIRARAGFDRIWIITLRDEAGVIGDWAPGDLPSAYMWLGDLGRKATASLIPEIAWHDTVDEGGVQRPGRLAGQLRLSVSANLTRGKGGTYGAIARIATAGGEMIEAWSGTVEIANSLVF